MSIPVVIKIEPSASKFDMRAPPRRRAKGNEVEEQPIFLRKAFAMITSCPPEIGGWSEKGDTVIIKDVKLFTEKIIPTSYKHNNFSSFVRQLNFYGFRKIKSESLENPSWWEFRHPNFLKGQPHLLSDIKRSVHFVPESASSKEVTDLKEQVSSLTEQLSALHDQVEFLSSAMKELKVDNSSTETSGSDSIKKRKVTLSLASPKSIPLQRMNSTDSSAMYRAECNDVPDASDFSNLEWEMDESPNDNVNEDDEMNLLGDLLTPTPRESVKISNSNSTDSMSELASSVQSSSIPASSQLPISTSDISQLFDTLPADLKVRFLDRLADSFGAQLAANVNLTNATATESVNANRTSTQSVTPTFMLPSGTQAPEIALPLASAALGAFVHSLHSFQQQRPTRTHSASVAVSVSDQIVAV